MKFFIYIFYRFFNKGYHKSIAYEKAISFPYLISCIYFTAAGLIMDVDISVKQGCILLILYLTIAVLVTFKRVPKRDIAYNMHFKNTYNPFYGMLAVLYLVAGLVFFGIAANIAHQRKFDLQNEMKQKGIYDINY